MNSRRWDWIWLCICISVTPVGAQQSLQKTIARQEVSLNIPSQPLEDALNSFSRQTHLKLAFYAELGRGLVSPRIAGSYTPEAALQLLLANTGLRFKYLDPESVAILPNDPGANSPVITSPSTRLVNEPGEGGEADSALGTKSSDRSGKQSDSNQTDKEREFDSNKHQQIGTTLLEGIVVTAQKRSEKLMDVPASISAISGERLESLHVNSLADLANFVPGLSVTDEGGPGNRLIAIRGLSTGYHPTAGSLVGMYIDDFPVGDSTSNADGALFGLDLNPYDIDHIEVLKGPQGTLYGANTMGGLIKYVLRQPDPTQFAASAGADGGHITGSDGANWSVRGAVNLPIVTDTLAIRLSGFNNHTAGYIDNIITGEKGVNHWTEKGGRGALLWQVTDSVSVRATVLAQDVNVANSTAVTLNGASTLQPLFGTNKISSYFPQPDTQQSRLYSIGVDWDLNFAKLTSSTGWSRVSNFFTNDFTSAFGPFVPGHPDGLVAASRWDRASKFVEEIRLTSPENQRIQWMLGGYYTKESAWQSQYLPTFTRSYVLLPPADLFLLYINSGDYKESAGFANITYNLTNRFDVSAGGRYSAYSETACNSQAAGLFGNGVILGCTSLPSTGVSVWMANARFHLNKDAMLYGRVATGYRPGQGCPTCGVPALGIPGVVNPDKTTNYEAGFKGSLFDQRLLVDVSAFHINWTDIQLTQRTPPPLSLNYPGNGGTAVSNGLELTTAYLLIEGLRLNATLGYTDAHLTQDAPVAGGKSGDQLPGSPRLTGSITADYSRPLDDRHVLLFGAGHRYRDAVVNQFVHSGLPLPSGPQNIADLYTGLVVRGATIRLYGTNIFNNRSYSGLLYVADPTKPAFVPVQPRTIGLSVDYRFSKGE